MYEAKRTFVHSALYRPEIDRYSPARLRLAGEVRRAIDERELYLAYQPKLSLPAGRIYGVEALLRWRHPERGVIPPLDFLPVVENTELIHDVTRFVLEEAVAQCAAWQADGIALTVAVNLSARNLAEAELPAQIAATLQRHGVAPASLEVELTETAVLVDPERARHALNEIHDLGVRVAIDDFGTGYASLAYVSSLPVDTLKIDGSFVQAMVADTRAEAIVRFTIGLGRSLGMSVVAEGVEDGAAFSRLAALGCEHLQGYRIAKPMVPVELAHFLNSIGRPIAAPPGLPIASLATPLAS